uniref:Uncharacterized protein n=1 Tax=Arundo donax TaxID=35708 RepID=A0A0A9BTS9_ARUDO
MLVTGELLAASKEGSACSASGRSNLLWPGSSPSCWGTWRLS